MTAGILATASYLRQFFPRLAGERRRRIVGKVRDFPVDTYTYLEEHQLFIYRDHEGVRAMSAVCTHLGCILDSTAEGFECPCHGSCYNTRGEVLAGPAPRNLSWCRMRATADGRLEVDPGAEVGPEETLNIS
jgi:cytochrome b6-f complex iron-sulfur subunit